MQDLESNIIEHSVGLVILDSVAALVRPLNSRDRIFDRQEMVGQQAARLKYLAEAFKIPVVVTNQVINRQSIQQNNINASKAVIIFDGKKNNHFAEKIYNTRNIEDSRKT